MESNLQSGSMNPSGGPAFGALDLQGSMGVNHHQHPHNLQQHHHHHHSQANPMSDYNPSSERGKNLPSDDEHDFHDEMDGDQGSNGGGNKASSIWRRVKWTDAMIKLLITALSYVGDDGAPDGCNRGRRKFFHLQKKGKWKSISKVMSERGFYVSPQQCEDKFNDLNKRYKKLNDILGRGTSCEVVENPALLDMMDHLPEKSKDEVRKILSSKHLFYEEMCSYHNGNRLHLPHDPALQRSLQAALRSKDEHDHDHDDDDGDDHDIETDDHEDCYDHGRVGGGCGLLGESTKRIKQGQSSLEDFSFGNLQPTNFEFNANMHPGLQNQSWKVRSLQLEEQKLQIQLETVDLERQRLKWQRFSKKKDRELEKLRIENEKMRLENERMAIKLKQMELAMKNHQ